MVAGVEVSARDGFAQVIRAPARAGDGVAAGVKVVGPALVSGDAFADGVAVAEVEEDWMIE